MKLTLGFSPCPNDTFIFDALVNKKIDTEGLEFEVVTEDVETLNKWGLEGKLDITKLSFPALFRSLDNYVLLNTGAALGNGVGPLVISKSGETMTKEEISAASVVLPGVNTTANLLFSFAFPEATNKQYKVFSEIEDAVLNDEAKLGVIIHENRFTYEDKGLHKLMDLGEYWEIKMNVPIPLGGIAINQGVKRSVALKVEQLIKKSIQYAFDKYPVIADYVKENSQSMSEDVMRQHIDLYVNDFSLDLGEAGQDAIEALYKVHFKNNPKEENEDFQSLFF